METTGLAVTPSSVDLAVLLTKGPPDMPAVNSVRLIIAASVAGGLLVLSVPICILYACHRSRGLKKSTMDRRANLRAAIKRKSGGAGNDTMHLNEDGSRRPRLPPLSKTENSVLTIAGVTVDDTSDSVESTPQPPSSYDRSIPCIKLYASMENSTYANMDFGGVDDELTPVSSDGRNGFGYHTLDCPSDTQSQHSDGISNELCGVMAAPHQMTQADCGEDGDGRLGQAMISDHMEFTNPAAFFKDSADNQSEEGRSDGRRPSASLGKSVAGFSQSHDNCYGNPSFEEDISNSSNNGGSLTQSEDGSYLIHEWQETPEVGSVQSGIDSEL